MSLRQVFRKAPAACGGRFSAARVQRVLLCPATDFGVRYSINPWMAVDNPAENGRAVRQWARLRDAIESLGYETCEVACDAKDALPDIVFTANAGLVWGDACVLANFRHPERRGEQPFYKRWFVEHGYDVHELPDGVYFEGAGDALFADGFLAGGHGFRSDRAAYDHVRDRLGVEVVPCRLVNPYFYHLDTCFCPLDGGQALIYAEAFDRESLAALRRRLDLIQVPEYEARRFACNAVALGASVIMPSGCPLTRGRLERRGFAVRCCDMSEFMKAGGACKCLTLLV
jgi:N-dimethylarginine dimethylaminohydrolase